MSPARAEVDKLYKEHFGKMVASLLYSSRDIDLETAEDIVQDSFSAALTDWQKNGLPFHPTGWLYKVCKNKALNKIRNHKRTQGLRDDLNLQDVEVKFAETAFDDQQLKLLFACAHPDLTPKTQVVITLKYVANLKVEAIARILAMTIDGVDKILLRARQKIKDEKILLEEPVLAALKPRLGIVHKILYLIFNEGYKSSWGKEILREELCEDALFMTKGLINSGLATKETNALYALMLFNAARFKARFGASGELLDLEKQDRSLWNTELILLATDFLVGARSNLLSSYHLEASIAFVHCTAKSFNTTDWKTIRQLYEQLLRNNPNPFVELNYAIALYYAGEKERAFAMLHELHRHPFFNQYCSLNVTLGKFYLLEGNAQKAKTFLERASTQTSFEKEKDLIRRLVSDAEAQVRSSNGKQV
ncbi:MAG TPA: sigma-70 family RNA polymerase sigma factor [Chryseolinea sp.]